MKNRTILAGLSLVMVFVLVVGIGCGKKSGGDDSQSQSADKTYRNVKVIEITGEVSLTRGNEPTSAYPELIIQDGDILTTGSDGVVSLRLDSDKYARLGENSEASFELEGNPEKGAIRIHLASGSIYNEIENPLSDGDAYEIHTPDAVMAVRGTAFDVIIIQTPDGRETHVNTQSGNVQITVLNGEGETVLTEPGQEVIIDGGNNQTLEPHIRQPEESEVTTPSSTENETSTAATTELTTENQGTQTQEKETQAPQTQVPQTQAPQTQEQERPQETQEPQIIKCPFCKVEVSRTDLHKLSCGNGHYSCDNLNHTACSICGKVLCDTNIHQPEECGNHYYPCDESYAFDGHELMPCGHYLCEMLENDLIHEKCAICNQWACQSGIPHQWAECNCVYCGDTIGQEHVWCDACGSCKSDGLIHGLCEYCQMCIKSGEHGDGVCNNNTGT